MAAVKYTVYNGNSWISFDDAETFKLKIDYANRLGLGGLMIWAIDQDDGDLHALRAISGSSLPDASIPFTLVDLNRLWPKQDMPSDAAIPRYGMVNFGDKADTGSADPRETGFGFFLVAGESFAVSKLKKRHGEVEPFTFLNCPERVLQQPDGAVQTARVVCLNSTLR